MLAAHDLCFGILDHLNIKVEQGESLAVLGPSNSGKSLLLKTLAGLRKPDSGQVQLGKLEVTGRPNPALGMTFQQGGLFDSWTVGENLQFALEEKPKQEGSEASLTPKEALLAVGLEGTENRRISELSGGMQKRLGIARALMLRPRALLLDEPTAGLDPLTARQILSLIGSLREKYGMSVILVTSDPAQAEQVCENMILLLEGKIHEAGAIALLRKKGSPQTVQFLSGSAEGPL